MSSDNHARIEWLKCGSSATYFTREYVQIYNATYSQWLPFNLWRAQVNTLQTMEANRLLVILKARQLGISWLALAYCLHVLIFNAPSTILLFSLRELEAVELLGRLKGMYDRLPRWMRARITLRDNDKNIELSNGSRALAFSTKSGRSYTGSIALVDEADFIPDLSSFLNGVKPTIDAGGKMFLISTSDKSRPVSTFKNIYRAAQTDDSPSEYVPIFLPWTARPGRDARWHERTKAEMFAQRGTHDDFYAEYPATVEEALAPEQLNRRFPWDWLKLCIDERSPLTNQTMPALNGLSVYTCPNASHHYVIGADPAEGNPNSDDSAATVLDAKNWEQVATLAGKFEPSTFADYLDTLSEYYNQADILPERNNHGHSLINSLFSNGRSRVLDGYDDKPGWLSNVKGKPLMYDALAEAIKDQSCVVRNPVTISQLASIQASDLRAPEGLHDDHADAFALAIAALLYGNYNATPSLAIAPPDPLQELDSRQGY